MGNYRALGRLLLFVALPLPWLSVSCSDDSSTNNPAGNAGEGGEGNAMNGGTKATGGTKTTGGTKATGGTNTNGGTANGGEPGTAGDTATGGSLSESGGAGGMEAVGGNGALCADVTCAYGQKCVAGSCESACPPGKILCSGSCIDPKTSDLFCGAVGTCDKGAGPNEQTAPLGEGGANAGGAGGAGGADPGPVVIPNAGEHCADGFTCQTGQCTYSGLKPGSDAVVVRDGFSVQCKEWMDQTCLKPWIQIPLSAVVTPANCAEPIETSLRPVWYYSKGEEEARTWCWIATGNSNVRAYDVDGVDAVECGWMYGSYQNVQLDCDDFRRYSEVDSPGDIPNITWSFDILTGDGCRDGSYMSFQCYWE